MKKQILIIEDAVEIVEIYKDFIFNEDKCELTVLDDLNVVKEKMKGFDKYDLILSDNNIHNGTMLSVMEDLTKINNKVLVVSGDSHLKTTFEKLDIKQFFFKPNICVFLSEIEQFVK